MERTLERIISLKREYAYDMPIESVPDSTLKRVERSEIMTLEKADGRLFMNTYAVNREKLEIYSSKFTNMSFRNMRIRKAVFVNCLFDDMSIKETILNDAIFIGCVFRDARFVQCELNRATFIECRFSGSSLDRVRMNAAWVVDSNFSNLEYESDIGSPHYTEMDDISIETTEGGRLHPTEEATVFPQEVITTTEETDRDKKKEEIKNMENENILSQGVEMDQTETAEIRKGMIFKKTFTSLDEKFDFTGKKFQGCRFEGIDFCTTITDGAFFASCTFIKCSFSYQLRSVIMKTCTFDSVSFIGKISHVLFDNCKFMNIPDVENPRISDCEFKNCTEDGDKVIRLLEMSHDSFATDQLINSIDMELHQKQLAEARAEGESAGREEALKRREALEKEISYLKAELDTAKEERIDYDEAIGSVASSLKSLGDNLGTLLEAASSRQQVKEVVKEVRVEREPDENECRAIAVAYYDSLSESDKWSFVRQSGDFSPSAGTSATEPAMDNSFHEEEQEEGSAHDDSADPSAVSIDFDSVEQSFEDDDEDDSFI